MMHTADLVDKYDAQLAFCDLPFKAFGKRRAFYGAIQTLKCYEDNALLKAQLQTPGDKRVLVVDAGASSKVAVLGDILAELLRVNDWAGIIINGAIRDSAVINRMDVGLRCLGTSPKKSRKTGAGVLGGALQFGGVVFTAGHFVYCDADGILVAATCLV